LSVGRAIAKARADKQPPWKQSELAQKVNEKPSVINDYENGRAVPNQQILGKMERVLGVKLRGKDIGAKLDDKHASKEKK
jgi:putative transcription factor